MARPSDGASNPPAPLSPFAAPYGPGEPTAPAGRSAPTPAGLLYALKRRWVLATFVGGLAAAAAAAAVWAGMPAGKHTARALVQLRPAGPDVVNRSPEEFDGFRKSQMFLLRTRDLINRTLADPAVAGLDAVRKADDPVRMLEDNLKVDAALAPDVLTVSLTGDSPADLVVVVDALVKRYVEDATAHDRRARDDRRRELDRMAEGFQAEIQARERQIRLASEANGVLGPEAAEAKHARMQGELAKVEADAFAVQREVQDAEVQIELLQKKLADRRFDLSPAELAGLVDAHPRVAPLLQQKRDRVAALGRAREVATDDRAPAVKDIKAQIAQAEKAAEVARLAVKAEIEADLKAAAERALSARLADAKERLESTRRTLASRLKWRDEYQKMLTNSTKGAYDIQALQEEIRPHKEFLNRVVGQRVQLDAEKEVRPRVAVREAAVPLLHQNQKQKTMLAAGAAGFAFLGVLAAVGYLEWRGRRVDGVEQVVAELGLRVIGTVPAFPSKARLAAAGGGGDADWRFALNEAVNSTRTMLLHAARNQSMQVVMVTSATQGEGKTSLTTQLGTSMAGSGMRTLIVDCDLRNPSVHKLFDLGEPGAGVGEVLCQEADAADAVQPTAVPNLWVIPAGRCSARVVAALAQGHPLETLFNRLRGQFDFILVDTCPVLPVADALLIGQHVDGVVFSIMQDVSQVPQVQVASDRLAQLNIPLLGAVVNGVRPGPGYHAYGYNYVKQLPA